MVVAQGSSRQSEPGIEADSHSQPILIEAGTGFEGLVGCRSGVKEYLRLIYGDFDEVVYTYVDAAPAKTRRQADTTRRDG